MTAFSHSEYAFEKCKSNAQPNCVCNLAYLLWLELSPEHRKKAVLLRSRHLYPRFNPEDRMEKGAHHMSTSKLSQKASLAVVPSLPPLMTWVSGALHRIRALQMPVVD